MANPSYSQCRTASGIRLGRTGSTHTVLFKANPKGQIPNSKDGVRVLLQVVISAGVEIRGRGTRDLAFKEIPKDKFQIPKMEREYC